ncbi:MAG: hypothetical protein J6Y19_01570 [Kiritimatiellae bacterium]|nr:hypothetical protein [Kiritimatiellia bacterium]
MKTATLLALIGAILNLGARVFYFSPIREVWLNPASNPASVELVDSILGAICIIGWIVIAYFFVVLYKRQK